MYNLEYFRACGVDAVWRLRFRAAALFPLELHPPPPVPVFHLPSLSAQALYYGHSV